MKENIQIVSLGHPAIRIEAVSKRFKTPMRIHLPSPKDFRLRIEKPSKKQVLDGVSLEIPAGAVFGFLGPNGAGKTTLIKTITGLLEPDEGSTLVFDENGRAHSSDTREARKQIGYLPERPYWHDFLNAEEFLFFHGRLLGMDDSTILKRVPELLKRVGLASARWQKLSTFSKGMLQRIGFAQALLADPRILVLDEPMSGLDPVGRRDLRDIILSCAAEGRTIFFSTHIIHDVEVICTNVGYIRNGRLQSAGSIDQLLGKTVKSMEIRFSMPESSDPAKIRALSGARRAPDGWVIEIESDANRLEYDVTEALHRILGEKGFVRSVVPRRSTLEDLFFSESTAR